MKLLLTSAGLINGSIKQAFFDLLEKDVAECTVAFIPTAANKELNLEYLNQDIKNLKETGLKKVVVTDIEKIPKDEWLPIFQEADAILFGGGVTYHLLDQVRKSGLQTELKELLKSRLYIGISAGSIIPAPDLKIANLFKEEAEYKLDDVTGLGLVDFSVLPHFGSQDFQEPTPDQIAQFAKTVDYPIYAIDDQSAIQVVDGQIKIISEGKWKKYG
ncbi:Type 1 glutamine amidotransferase-like domain-containing protein [Candidatus Kuenenbacteria bacterium]|nr:Type 1 glutamine amidotransferase-like domain-containing protein [Candidatus Kuenenbacteria bacterium]